MWRILAVTAALTFASPAAPALAQDAKGEAVAVAPLALAEGGFPHVGEDVGDGAAGGGLDLGVGVAERHVERAREPAAHARLAHSHKADQGDGATAQRFETVHE